MTAVPAFPRRGSDAALLIMNGDQLAQDFESLSASILSQVPDIDLVIDCTAL